MEQEIRETAVVEGDGTVKVRSSGLPAGATVQVTIRVDDPPHALPSLLSFRGAGKGCFATAQEVDEFIRRERDAWGI